MATGEPFPNLNPLTSVRDLTADRFSFTFREIAQQLRNHVDQTAGSLTGAAPPRKLCHPELVEGPLHGRKIPERRAIGNRSIIPRNAASNGRALSRGRVHAPPHLAPGRPAPHHEAQVAGRRHGHPSGCLRQAMSLRSIARANPALPRLAHTPPLRSSIWQRG